jgi:hypothetical protein
MIIGADFGRVENVILAMENDLNLYKNKTNY